MHTIQVTFPKDLPKGKYIEMMEGSMAKNEQGYTCKMKYLKMWKGEYLFAITTNHVHGFYFIGMVAYSIMKAIDELKPKKPKRKYGEGNIIYFTDN